MLNFENKRNGVKLIIQIITIISLIIVVSGVSVYATATYMANQVGYTTDKNGKILTVEDALNDLYNNINTSADVNTEIIDNWFVLQTGTDLSRNHSYTATKNEKIIIYMSIHSGIEAVDTKASYSVLKNNQVINPTFKNTANWNRSVYWIIDVLNGDVINYTANVIKAGTAASLSIFEIGIY